jgi:hypothetical protein
MFINVTAVCGGIAVADCDEESMETINYHGLCWMYR